jgi:hypothetical protein
MGGVNGGIGSGGSSGVNLSGLGGGGGPLPAWALAAHQQQLQGPNAQLGDFMGANAVRVHMGTACAVGAGAATRVLLPACCKVAYRAMTGCRVASQSELPLTAAHDWHGQVPAFTAVVCADRRQCWRQILALRQRPWMRGEAPTPVAAAPAQPTLRQTATPATATAAMVSHAPCEQPCACRFHMKFSASSLNAAVFSQHQCINASCVPTCLLTNHCGCNLQP